MGYWASGARHNRDASLDPAYKSFAISGNGIFKPIVVVNGNVAGIWKRTLKKNSVLIEINLFYKISAIEEQALEAKAKTFGDFLALDTKVEIKL